MKNALLTCFVLLVSSSVFAQNAIIEKVKRETDAGKFLQNTTYYKSINVFEYLGSDVEIFGTVLIDEMDKTKKVGTIMIAGDGYSLSQSKMLMFTRTAYYLNVSQTDSVVLVLRQICTDMTNPSRNFTINYITDGGLGFLYNSRSKKLHLLKYYIPDPNSNRYAYYSDFKPNGLNNQKVADIKNGDIAKIITPLIQAKQSVEKYLQENNWHCL